MAHATVAKVLVFNEAGRALILQVSVNRVDPSKSHTPDLPGGLVESDETPEEAAARETLEETGIELRLSDLQLVSTGSSVEEGALITKLLFVARLNGTPPVTLSWEHERYDWCPRDELPARLMSVPPTRMFFRDAVLQFVGRGPHSRK
jgi:8-oxo-dGTP pyrophosphatase MutT (NUDIX family)